MIMPENNLMHEESVLNLISIKACFAINSLALLLILAELVSMQ